MMDIEKGRPSRTKAPVRVSRLDSPRGGDGTHLGYAVIRKR